MSDVIRPDLSGLPDEVVAYIEALEAQVATRASRSARADSQAEVAFEPDEEPTTVNVISITRGGLAKRTPRHLYPRQRRAGMGIFDIDSPEEDPPAFLLMADAASEAASALILLTNQGRAFRIAVADITETPVRARGQAIFGALPLRADERINVVSLDQGSGFFCIVTERGQVRKFAAQFVGRNMIAGAVLHDPKEGGAPVGACWSRGNDEIMIITREGKAIRFAERLVPVRGCLGMRVEKDDNILTIAAAPADGGVFLLGEDGKGTIRMLEGFAANKAPGSGGKTLIKSDSLVAAFAVQPEEDDLFIISRLGKIIRFRAAEIPAKEGVVQGVILMTLRADACVAATATT